MPHTNTGAVARALAAARDEAALRYREAAEETLRLVAVATTKLTGAVDDPDAFPGALRALKDAANWGVRAEGRHAKLAELGLPGESEPCLSITLPGTLVDRLDARARASGVTVQDLIRQLVVALVEIEQGADDWAESESESGSGNESK